VDAKEYYLLLYSILKQFHNHLLKRLKLKENLKMPDNSKFNERQGLVSDWSRYIPITAMTFLGVG